MNDIPDIPLQAGPFKIEDMPIVIRPEEAPLIFLDGFQGLAAFGDVVRINGYQLIQNLDDPEGAPSRAFVARLAMSPMTVLQLMKWLAENVRFQALPEGGVQESGETH